MPAAFEGNLTDEEVAEIEGLMNKTEQIGGQVEKNVDNPPEKAIPQPQPQQQQKTLNGDRADPAKVKGTEESKERMYRVLELIGFTYSQEEKGERWRKNMGDLKIAIDFTPENPDGRAWAKPKGGDTFLSEEEVRELPVLKMARQLWTSDEPLPPAIIVANITAKSESGRGILVEFEDPFEGPKQIWYGVGAVKTNHAGAQGHDNKITEGEKFIPHGFSKQTKTAEAKLKLPRPIVLPDYEQQLAAAPVAHANGDSGGEEQKPAAPHQVQAPATPAVPKSTPAPVKRTMNDSVEVAKVKKSEAPETYADLMKECLHEGVDSVNDILAEAFHINDETKADLALRIAQSLFINMGKNRRTPRY